MTRKVLNIPETFGDKFAILTAPNAEDGFGILKENQDKVQFHDDGPAGCRRKGHSIAGKIRH